jgi:hypothetical protein
VRKLFEATFTSAFSNLSYIGSSENTTLTAFTLRLNQAVVGHTITPNGGAAIDVDYNPATGYVSGRAGTAAAGLQLHCKDIVGDTTFANLLLTRGRAQNVFDALNEFTISAGIIETAKNNITTAKQRAQEKRIKMQESLLKYTEQQKKKFAAMEAKYAESAATSYFLEMMMNPDKK